MRTLLLSLLTVSCFAPKDVLGQDEYPMKFGDTIPVERHSYSFTTRPDTFKGDTLFALLEDNCYVVQLMRGDNLTMLLLKKYKRKWKVLDLCPNRQGGSFTVDTINFDGKGSPEMIVRWNSELYTNEMQGGWSETSSGFYLWDIDNAQLIFNIQDVDEYSSSWNSRFIDSTGEVSAEVIEEHYCHNYHVELARERITISCRIECAEVDENSGKPLREYLEVYIYEQVGDILVRMK